MRRDNINTNATVGRSCFHRPSVLAPHRGVSGLQIEGGCSPELVLCSHQHALRIQLNITAELNGGDTLSLSVGESRQTFDGQSRPVPRCIVFSSANDSRLVAQLQLHGQLSTSHMAIRYDCTGAAHELTRADFEFALATRLLFPFAMMWFVAQLVLRRRRARHRRQASVPYEVLREDVEAVLATLALLPLVSYGEMRLGRDAAQKGDPGYEAGRFAGVSATAAPNAAPGISSSDALKQAAAADAIEQECGICLERFADGTICRVLPCRHFFCAECVDRWFETRGLSGQVATLGLPCPMCKGNAVTHTRQTDRPQTPD